MTPPPLAPNLVLQPQHHRLVLQIGRRGLEVVICPLNDGEGQTIVSYINLDASENRHTRAVQDAVYANPLLLQPFASVTVMVDTRQFFILPATERSPSTAARAMGFEDAQAEVLSVPIEDRNSLAMVADQGLIKFLRRTFPEAQITHPAAALARWWRSQRRPGAGERVCVFLGRERLTVVAFDSAGLSLCGSYEAAGIENQTYYVMAAATAAALDISDISYTVSGHADACSALIQRLRQFAHDVGPAIVPPHMPSEAPLTIVAKLLCE